MTTDQIRRLGWYIFLGCGVALAAALFVTNAYAIDWTVSGAELTVDYTEPTDNDVAVGDPAVLLVDLDKTTVYYDKGQGPVSAIDVPASSPAGGQAVTVKITVPVAIKQEANVGVWATATDTSGNESGPSNVVTKRVDRLPPKAPK